MTNLQRTYERQFGRPLREILIAALRDAPTVRQAALDLGISYKSLYRWSHEHSVDPAAEILKAKIGKVA